VDEFDVVCLGGGVCGEAVAGELKRTGLSLAVIERELVGGECPYWGCIPSKTLLRSAETLDEAGDARMLAASRVDWTVDFRKISKRVLWMARDLDDTNAAKAIAGDGVELIRGEAHLTGPRTVTVAGRTLTARHGVVIATGTDPFVPPIPGLSELSFWTNREATLPKALPASLVILGGGAIGVELGQAYARIGSAVHIIEGGPRVVPAEEPEVGELLGKHLAGEGITVHTGHKVVGVEKTATGIRVLVDGAPGIEGEVLLVATGRRPRLATIDLAAAGLATNERGWLKVDRQTLAAADGIYAGGDVNGIGGFTHLAYYHGQLIGRALAGKPAVADHTAVPRVTFTDPEVASVGLSEAAARAAGVDVITFATDPADSARGYIHDFKDGLVKLVGDRRAGVLVGATILQPRAGEMLSELSLAVKTKTPLAVMADLIHPFPAFSRILGYCLQELAKQATG
jgi:pyruvate/2-oxoglutarate dehydrogenase complex dihydrolipoamide dehydrogenase (E3) component